MRRAVVWVSYRASFSLAYAAAKTFTTFVASCGLVGNIGICIYIYIYIYTYI